jgi:hypothetical protein
MKPLKIKVLWNNSTTQLLESLDIETNYDDCDEKLVTIYHIDSITPIENDKEKQEYSRIITFNTIYIVRMSFEELDALIDRHIRNF